MPGATKTNHTTRSASRGIEVIRGDVFSDLPWLVHGFSTRTGGGSTCYGGKSLNLGINSDDTHENVERNRRLFVQALGAINRDRTSWPLGQVRQIHSAIIRRVDAQPQNAPAGDGMLTAVPGLLLAINTADCVPVLVADVEQRVVAAFHAGWRGTVARILEKGIGEMRRHFASDPQNVRAAIGPCIRKCCYSVGADVKAQFESQFSYAAELFEEVFDSNAIQVRYPLLFLNQRAPGHGNLGPEVHLDLVSANRRQLLDSGLQEEHISVIEGCTACDTERFFSYRAGFGRTGRMMAAIGIRRE